MYLHDMIIEVKVVSLEYIRITMVGLTLILMLLWKVVYIKSLDAWL